MKNARSTVHQVPRSVSRRRRVLSLCAYLAALAILSSVVVTHRVSASLHETSLSFGRRLDAFNELGRATEIAWNDQVLALRSTTVNAPVEEVLERFVALCDAGNEALVRELSQALAGERVKRGLSRMLVLRDLFDDGTGSAVCLAGLGDGGLESLAARARRFADTWNLAELGNLRYAFFRRLDEARTHVLLVTADGELRLDRLVPRAGEDAPGDDAIPGVRPEGAVRLLSARAKGTPHVLSAYRSPHRAAEALVAYGRLLESKGLSRVADLAKPPEQVDARSVVLTRAYRRGDEVFVVGARDYEEASMLSVTRIAAEPIPAPYAPR